MTLDFPLSLSDYFSFTRRGFCSREEGLLCFISLGYFPSSLYFSLV